MGEQKISLAKDPEARKYFLRHLLRDVEAIERILKENIFESGVVRIGAEQEFCLVDSHFKPSKNASVILQMVDDDHFTSELAKYNLEINLDPLPIGPRCFSEMENQLTDLLSKAEDAAGSMDEKVILTGILPSIDFRAVQIEYLTPKKRYKALTDILYELRGEDFELNIIGVDELILRHSNILFEACNTSFQCHLQIEPNRFTDLYNWAQMISGPVLSVAANSPLLLGKQLWSETRIALFQQSIDTRGKGFNFREREQRVTFGNRWIRDLGDVFKNDIARHTLLFSTDLEKDSLELLDEGVIPKLDALQLHNGTVYKWNRPCYGVTDGVPHLRIENRYLPSGPTEKDEIANLAFWTGLMSNMPEQFESNWQEQSFEDAKENFYKAAMWGIQSGMVWEDNLMSARRLILEILLPMAKGGLEKLKIDSDEINHYLSIIEKRAAKHSTGARWIVNSFRSLRRSYSKEEAAVAITAMMHQKRASGKQLHDWEVVRPEDLKDVKFRYDVVSSVMSTDLVTVTENDLAELVLKIMDWRQIRHLPVEDLNGELKGIITKKRLIRYLEDHKNDPFSIASDVMDDNPITIGPNEDLKYAMLLMLDHKISCLPVVEKGRLVGILTDKDTHEIWEKIKKSDDSRN
ncbi:CBS domain-containing protein [Rhodohalobacter sp. SW132]|uniref:CBS domain-containing protein n=1 Tax=Rhodohalobacter sp. SW132 TaxID=2293433 RepID=UPI000E2448D7|nr:CBS domain-containing protein [Rhodohalobacter sp. SW132]REL33486.1 CBS domain-containing protein [Rhodohalobacter sp. SW132]